MAVVALRPAGAQLIERGIPALPIDLGQLVGLVRPLALLLQLPAQLLHLPLGQLSACRVVGALPYRACSGRTWRAFAGLVLVQNDKKARPMMWKLLKKRDCDF